MHSFPRQITRVRTTPSQCVYQPSIRLERRWNISAASTKQQLQCARALRSGAGVPVTIGWNVGMSQVDCSNGTTFQDDF
jgi:hypothetical protein